MKEPEGGREEIRDHYEGQGINMGLAVDQESILEKPAKDSPAMTGESREELDYNSYSD